MQELITEITRLYLFADQQCEGQAVSAAMLQQHLRGERRLALELIAGQRMMRTLLMRFDGAQAGKGAQQWEALCAVANGLQNQLDLPAPAVSISGRDGYCLWISLATPVPVSQGQRFAELLWAAYAPNASPDADLRATLAQMVVLPPCLDPVSGKWAAFIHPGMGAAFADEPGLEMAPPLAAQAGFLASLVSISPPQFAQALAGLEHTHGVRTDAGPSLPQPAAPGLLLKDATLEDIVQFLHQKNIEPTFRYLLEKSGPCQASSGSNCG